MAWSSLYKIPFLLSQSLALYIAFTPPHVSPPDSTKELDPCIMRDKFGIRLGFPILKGLFLGATIAETCVIVAKWCPDTILTTKILSRLVLSGSADNIRLTPMFILGSVITALGCFIRYRCYRELGKYFTFELNIQKGHKLVTTGPYSYVRHPSYIGMALVVGGVWVGYLGKGSWLKECGFLDITVVKILAAIWSCTGCALMGNLLARIPTEDAMIRQKFGAEWVDWARRVPYLLIPGIY